MADRKRSAPEFPERTRRSKNRKGPKPYTLEIRSVEGRGWGSFPVWALIRRYRTERDVRQAFSTYVDNRHLWHVRIAGPDGVIDEHLRTS